MSFFSGALSSLGNSFLGSAVSSLTSSVFGALGSGFSSLTSSLGDFFKSDSGGLGSSGLSSLFSKDTFDDVGSIQAAASSPSAGVDVRAGAAQENLGVARFASSFDFDDEPAPMK